MDVLPEKIRLEDLLHESGQNFTPETGGRSDVVFKRLTITWYEFLARGRLTSSVCASEGEKNVLQQHIALEAVSSSTLKRYVGIRAGGLR